MGANCLSFVCFVCVHVVQLPRITSQQKENQGQFLKFTIQAIGTKPLSYQWQWKPAWQPCDAEWCDSSTLTIPSVQKSNEGSYRCVISNCAGTQTSNPAGLSVGKNSTNNCLYTICMYFVFIHVAQCPGITSQPQGQLSVGKNIILTVHKKYHTHSLLLCTFPNVAEPPKIITHPQELKIAFQGKPVMFTIQATGTEPLSYHWERKPKKKWSQSGKWQPCPAEWCDGATLTIPSVQKSNEGSYHCVISNDIGSQTSNAANLSVGKNHVMLEFKVYIAPT